MNETRQEQIARYVAGYTGSRPKPVLTTWLIESVAILDGWGISEPTKADYQRLKFELIATKRGKKGSSLSEGQADKYISATKNFYKWLKQQEGETQQMRLFEETEAIRANEPEGAEPQQGENEPKAESVAVQEVIGADDGADVQEVTTEEKDTQAFSPVDTPEAEYITDTESKPKRGRKPKPENADRVQLSVYFSRDIYEGLKTLAQAKGLNISDILAPVAKRLVEQNSQTIAIAQQALRNLAALDIEY